MNPTRCFPPCLARLSAVLLLAVLPAPARPAAAAPEPPRNVDAAGHHAPARRPAATSLATPTVTVPLDLSTDRPVIEATINGKGPFRFILDTGAGVCVLDRDLAQEIGLQPAGKDRVGDPMQPQAIEADSYELAEVSIGGATFRSVPALGIDSPLGGGGPNSSRGPGGPAPTPAAATGRGGTRGVLGYPLFLDLLWTLDFPHRQLVLEKGSLPEPDGDTIVAYTTPFGIPRLSLDVGGARIDADLDTGSPSVLTLPTRQKDLVPLAGPLREAGRGRTVATEFTVYTAQLDTTFRLGGYDFQRPYLRFNDQFPSGNLGTGILRAAAVTLDPAHERVRFVTDPAAAELALRNARPPRTGMRLSGPPGTVPGVAGVDPGSPAARAGVREGDVVVRVNGAPTESLTAEARRAAFQADRVTLGLKRGEQVLEVELDLR